MLSYILLASEKLFEPKTGRFFRQSFAALFICALLIACLGCFTDLDQELKNWIYDPVRQAFPWEETWFAAVFMHRWVKYLCILIGVGTIALLLSDLVLKRAKLGTDTRRTLAVVAPSFAFVPAASA